jgi:hypothetical protein
VSGGPYDRPRAELLELAGSAQQLASLERFTLTEGKAKGVEGVRFETGSGLAGTILVDRALDLADLRYQGRSLCWRSPAGVVAPGFYEREGNGWLRSFGGGMLVTCGLRNVGTPSREGWESFGLHGEISHTPAVRVAANSRWEGERYALEVAGEVHEAYLGGPQLVLRRRWRTELGAAWVELEDAVTNEGQRQELHMQLYHWNFGFPLLTPSSELRLTTDVVRPRDESAAAQLSRWHLGEEPTAGAAGPCFYHRRKQARLGEERAVLVSDAAARDFGVELRWDAETLPFLVQWKNCGAPDYVLGIEPANCLVEGREAHRASGLKPIAPGETRRYALRLAVLDGAGAVAAALQDCRAPAEVEVEPVPDRGPVKGQEGRKER